MAAVPVPLVTLQTCPEGWIGTVTSYTIPSESTGPKVKVFAPELMSRFTPLLVSARPSVVNPLTVPDKVSAGLFELPPHDTSESRLAAIALRAETPLKDEPGNCRCTCVIS